MSKIAISFSSEEMKRIDKYRVMFNQKTYSKTIKQMIRMFKSE